MLIKYKQHLLYKINVAHVFDGCRVFALIENSAQEHIHGNQDNLNPEQLIVEKALASCFTSVLQQCSTPIFMVHINIFALWFH